MCNCENLLDMLNVTFIRYYTLDLIKTVSSGTVHPTSTLSFCLLDFLTLLQILALGVYNQINNAEAIIWHKPSSFD